MDAMCRSRVVARGRVMVAIGRVYLSKRTGYYMVHDIHGDAAVCSYYPDRKCYTDENDRVLFSAIAIRSPDRLIEGEEMRGAGTMAQHEPRRGEITHIREYLLYSTIRIFPMTTHIGATHQPLPQKTRSEGTYRPA